VELTWRERRALREIEEALVTEDPALNELLSAPPSLRWARFLRKVSWVIAAIAATFVLGGLVLSDPYLLLAGVLMVSAVMATRRWASALSHDP
jgi:hypothetical protein